MAHMLESINGRIAMMYQGETPWHHLGTRTNGSTDVQSALALASLADWDLRLEPLYLADSRQVEDRLAHVRGLDNRIISTVGADYTTLSNEAASAVLTPVCRDHGVTIESAGSIQGGKRVWMLARMADSVEPIPGDRVAGYFLTSWGHDGSAGFSGRLTPIRVVCKNTLDAAESHGAAMFRFRHTTSITDNARQAEKLVTAMTASLRATGETYASMARRTMNRDEIARYITGLFPLSADPEIAKTQDVIRKRQITVADLVFHGKGAREFGTADLNSGTASAWGIYNAVAEYIDHVRPAEAKSSGAREAATLASVFGLGAQIKITALARARELVTV